VDSDLVVQARHGDRDAFSILARTHADRLYAIGYRILRDPGLAEDAMQQALVIAWEQLPSLRDAEKFTAWITRLLVHECYAESKRRTRIASNIRVLPAEPPDASDAIPSIVDRDELERGFRRLPTDQRAVLVLHHYVGLEPAEIATTLGIAPGTVRSRLHYAHRAMRAVLEADARPTAAAGGSDR
jgi:RNA polymerase sigma-70 factor (ECF subfamily)